jgi:outer membrane protein assembly factor BamD (BamD/ComL family)
LQSDGDLSKLLNTPEKKVQTSEKNYEDNLISETLAKIFLNQGEVNEAVKIYEKLIKKYPLKQLYFESKIKEIRSANQQ